MALQTGAQPAEIIFANPCKTVEAIKFARTVGVKWMTFDSIEEAQKIKHYFPDAQAILRIFVPETDAACPIDKFGAPEKDISDILDECKHINLSVPGVSFHVGSGGCSFSIYKRALEISE